MRSTLFSSILIISLGLVAPIVSAIGFPEVAVAQSVDKRKVEADRLLRQGMQQYKEKRSDVAIQSVSQALRIYREIKDRKFEESALSLLGLYDGDPSHQMKKNEYLEQALVIARELKDRQSEMIVLSELGLNYSSKNDPKAFEYLELALVIARELKDRQSEAGFLLLLNGQYLSVQNYPKVVEYLESVLVIQRELKNREGEAFTLALLGLVYFANGDGINAVKYLEPGLNLARETQNKPAELLALTGLGNSSNFLGQYEKAIEYSQKGLTMARAEKDQSLELSALGSLGNAHLALGNYDKATEIYEQSLTNARKLKNPLLEGLTLTNLGAISTALGDYPKAIEYQKRGLEIIRKLKNRRAENDVLYSLGHTYYAAGNYVESMNCYQQALDIAREFKNKYNEGIALTGMGASYFGLKNYTKGIEYQEQALIVSRTSKNPGTEASALVNLGQNYQGSGNYTKALYYYEQALAVAHEIGYPEGERLAFGKIASVLQDQKKPDLAIAYYRQSIKVSESMRQSTRTLPTNLQVSYSQAISETYRDLASLLISQGRNGEAQQVLELLKVQDLNEFAVATRSTIPRIDNGASTSAPAIQVEINTLMAFGKTLDDCRRSSCSSLSSLESQYQERRLSAEQTINQIEAKAKNNPSIAGRTSDFTQSADKLANRPNTAVVYPVVNTDGVQLLWMTQGKVNGSATCPLPKAKLNDHINTFRNLISNRDSDLNVLKSEGKILYDCLVGPLDAAFKANKITNIIFIPDLTTSYIPLAALYDGTNYLVDRYTVSNALSASLTDTTDRLPANASILGLGLTDKYPGYDALPNVQLELDSIVKTNATTTGIFPGTTFLNTQFTLNTLNGNNQKNLRDRKIVHIATHGVFLPADPKASYLLLGNGDRFPIYQIQDLDALRNTHLVVLSACETGVGGKNNNGTEISGISSYFLNDRAKSVLASLWKVDDASTSLLMQNFYQNLSAGMSKPEALRQAQLNLLTQKITAKTATDRGVRLYRPPGATAQNFAHPYFWAPFTLTGNPN